MTRKTALLSGASAGIGRATAVVMAEKGFDLILVARRERALLELARQLHDRSGVDVHTIACDINDRETVSDALAALPERFSQIDVLINNAGLALGLEPADKTEWQDWQTMIETNCMSLAFMTRQILPAMVERNSGLIINMGSTAGSYAYRGGNVYGASKAFVEHFSISLRSDLLGTKVRVTNLVPGLVGETEFSTVRFHGDQAAADAVYQGHEPLKPEDIANTVGWIVSQPNRVNINSLEIMPVCQAPIGLGLKS